MKCQLVLFVLCQLVCVLTHTVVGYVFIYPTSYNLNEVIVVFLIEEWNRDTTITFYV